MNQKPVKYFLIGGVVVVWGLIIYRVIDGLNPDDVPAIKVVNTMATNYIPPTDTFTLIADYSDPFIPGEDTVEADMTVKTAVAPPPSPPPVVKPPPDTYKEGTIQYEGMISNPAKKIKLGTIVIKGKEMLVKEKEKVEDYLIEKITAETIVIRYKGKKIPISKS
jgi:hypothetical protein